MIYLIGGLSMDRMEQLQSKVLQAEQRPGDYELYRAALEWELIDPIVIESQDDLKSQPRWQERIQPFHHQVTNLMTFCRRLPVTLLADDVGLGKTISAGLVVSELAARSRLQKVLVVAPKLLGPQWKEELETKFNIPAEVAIGKDLLSADPTGVGVVITTYNTARLYIEKLPPDRFQMLILDEAHKLRNLFGTDQAPQVALRFQKALQDRRFRFVLMLTATPIQNRLWDLYSLVSLLSVARGHENPFGSEGMFARRFIADDRESARRLRLEAKDEFQSIVYSYMSRVRRGDAKLYFPDRVVRMERVQPSAGELALIEAIAKPIQQLNRLTQISILQALTSSPEALSAQLQNMGEKGTVPAELVQTVKTIVSRMSTTSKLKGLGALIERLKGENPDRWRLVVFTTRRETQTTIEAFLSSHGLKVGLINGSTGGRNQDTLKAFRANPPQLNVIVSTEAGSEGVNLQVANVLVNYDLPWNPMIVEQRIGRVQRLASTHANVSIFNMMLLGTFEEYIVGRLMEKLQLASHAIGDIESLLEASGVGDGDDGGGFDETLRKLVVAALAGADTSTARRLAEQSIEDAKVELERERATIDAMLGNMDGSAETGPRAPKLPPISRSMTAKEFVLGAYKSLGADLRALGPDRYMVDQRGARHEIALSQTALEGTRASLHEPGSSAFSRLVTRIAGSGVHKVRDRASDPEDALRRVARGWLSGIDARPRGASIKRAYRQFEGQALVRVRALTQHDSYERLIDVPCSTAIHSMSGGRGALQKSNLLIEDATSVGLNMEAVREAAERDPAIAEFCRFYLERRAIEERSAAGDERKRHKLREDFTPRLDMSVVGLDGEVSRQAEISLVYLLDGKHEYTDTLVVDVDTEKLLRMPDKALCAVSGRSVPASTLETCSFTGAKALRHRLTRSEASGRFAQNEFAVRCALSNKQVLKDEVESSALSGLSILKSLLKTSAITGKKAEPSYFVSCEFTSADVLKEETSVSEISGKRYRVDQRGVSDVSNKAGHRSEFIRCYETRQSLALAEAERCEVTANFVRPGILVACAATGKHVLPGLLERCSVTGKQVLSELLVSSCVSTRRLLETEAIVAVHGGRFCAPGEEIICAWSGRKAHPDDFAICKITGLPMHRENLTAHHPSALKPLIELLNGVRHSTDRSELWGDVARSLEVLLRGRVRIEAAHLSPDQNILAVRCTARTMLGFRSRRAVALYSLKDRSTIGKVAEESTLASVAKMTA